MAHFLGPAAEGKNGPPVIWLAEKGATVANPIKGQATLTPEQAQQFTAGEWYINPNGEIRGQSVAAQGLGRDEQAPEKSHARAERERWCDT